MKTNFLNPRIYAGIGVANATALVIIYLSKILIYVGEHYHSYNLPTVFIYSDFIIVPILMGIICAAFWQKLEMKSWSYVGYSLICGCVSIALSALLLGEGYICLIIVSPLLFGFIIGGAFIGKVMFRKKSKTLNTSVLSVLLIFFMTDIWSDHNYFNKVSDTIIVKAKPDEVWKHVVSYERIKTPNKYWLFNIGMPAPVESTVDGYYQGAGRKCIFSNGYTFDEKMVIYNPESNLTFDVTNQPRDPEIMGHIDILRGQFLLKDNGNGTTTLTGNSWYRLYVFPTWYYDIWAKSITRNVHLKVMQHIKELSEHI
jgi:hypothetical protein